MKGRLSETTITQVMEPVLPGTYAVLNEGGATDATRLFSFPIENIPALTPAHAMAQPVGVPLELPIIQRTGEVTHECLDGAAIDIVDGRGVEIRRLYRGRI